MDTIIITFDNNEKREYQKGIKLIDIINDVKKQYKYDIICGMFKNEIINYSDSIMKSGKLKLFDINTKVGNRIYEKGLTVLFKVTALEVLGKETNIKIRHSIDKGIYCEIDKKITEDDVKIIKMKMQEKVKKGIPFTKIETSRMDAIDYFKSMNRSDKVKTLFFNNSNYISVYKFDGVYNYMLGNMPTDSSCLKYFDLTLLEDKGIVLRYPSIYDDGKVVKYKHHEKYFDSLEEYAHWGSILNINNIGDLNEKVINGLSGEVINLSEMVQDYKLLNIAETISLNKDDIKLILISGPSSSGKTTTSKKLSLYLKTLGLNPYYLSIDDYFLNREETPLTEDGKYDFESLRAIDVKLFNSQIDKLLKGIKVTTPTFDFISGKKTFKNTIQLKENDVLIIEGLHALSNEILTNIPRNKKYKIYISPLAYLNVDDDNRISITDIRLLRRMVRDNRTRGYKPTDTLKVWHEVRKGEEKYVFPYQDEADVIFNSYLAYELGVLKTYLEPLLYSVKEDDEEYQTALNLINLLDIVLPIPGDDVPKISILREFIGGSFFE